MDEMILCVPRKIIPKELRNDRVSSPLQWEVLATALTSSSLMFLPRREVEGNPSLKQIIPYVLIRNSVGSLLCYERAGSEERLHGQLSLGIGGHVSMEDIEGRPNTKGELNLLTAGESFLEQVVCKAIERELEEEAGLDDGARARFMGVINEELTPVGRVHFGLVFEYLLNRGDSAVTGEELAHSSWMDMEEIYARRDEFELWSQLALELVERD
ncbi:MAG: hypothetical protein DRP87_00490 [Spirochaetes bacterium]|nr:MAG: hypothetical protein DRP87_00490 [Spirochaetota bacterium]